MPQGSPEGRQGPSRLGPSPLSPSQTQAALRAREFAADLFRRAQGPDGGRDEGDGERRRAEGGEKEASLCPVEKGGSRETLRGEEERCGEGSEEDGRHRTNFPQPSTSAAAVRHSEPVLSPASSFASSPRTPPSSSSQGASSEPGYVNYTRLHYCLQQPGAAEPDAGGERFVYFKPFGVYVNLSFVCLCMSILVYLIVVIGIEDIYQCIGSEYNAYIQYIS